MNENPEQTKVDGANPSAESRRAPRFKPGDIVIVNGITIDSVSKKYTPFKAKVVDTSDMGMQLSAAAGSFQAEKDTKVMITNSIERTGDTRHLIIVWSKSAEAEINFGCRYID